MAHLWAASVRSVLASVGVLLVLGTIGLFSSFQGAALSKHGRALRQVRAQEDYSHLPNTIEFNAVIRDFTADHPDFEAFDGFAEGLVKSGLGPDKKPVFNGGTQLSTKENFDQWYNDVEGVNKRMDFKLVMNKTEYGTYVNDSDSFFPADGHGWNDSAIALDGLPHNFYFTLELNTIFVYRGGEHFTFRGDDDVWVFIDGKLVIDLGGVHNPMIRTVDIDSLNLKKGAAVDLRFFFAERRCCGSKFRIETSITPVTGSCTIWGDPHVDVFDNGLFGAERDAPLGIFTIGDYWLVKNERVQIQARYGYTQYSVDNQSSLVALALDGPFLQNHKLIIEPMDDGKVTWDKEEIVKELPSEFLLDGFVKISFREGYAHIDEVLKGYPVKLINALMPNNVHLRVNRWPKHIDAIIQMPQQLRGQDGHCGNFNLDVSDDTKELVLGRMGAPVSAEESLFHDVAEVTANVHVERAVADCTLEVKTEAQRLCQAAGHVAGHLLDTCIFDVCFGGKDFAARGAVTLQEFRSEEGNN